MQAPTQEQLKDPQWWRANVPDWATVHLSHYRQEKACFASAHADGALAVIADARRAGFNLAKTCWHSPIPRPAKPDQEWVDGLPPVGWHGECTWGQKVNWFECVMLPRYCLALYKHGGWSLMDIFPEAGHEFRPLKTDAEREREEVWNEAVKVAHEATKHFGISGQIPMATIMSALYDAGLLRKGGE